MDTIRLNIAEDGSGYDLKGNMHFMTKEGVKYTLTQKDALNLMYTLYDSLGEPYTEPDRIAEIIDGEE